MTDTSELYPISRKQLIVWHVAGTVCAIVFVALMELVGASWVAMDADRVTAAIIDSLMIAIFMFFGTPFSIGFLFGWMKLTKKFPSIEQNSALRVIGLALTSAVASLMISMLLIALGDSRVFEDGWTYAVRLYEAQVGDLIWVALCWSVWAVAPRFLVPALRRPIYLRAWARAD